MSARLTRWGLALVLAAAAGAAVAGGPLQKLPPEYAFPRGEGSPGPVLFNHESHVDAKKPSCTSCHPRTFRILETGRTQKREVVTHERMEAGGACGACHGKTAFALDTCENCHK
jgi:c(7)-type cytochrome triheme protein